MGCVQRNPQGRCYFWVGFMRFPTPPLGAHLWVSPPAAGRHGSGVCAFMMFVGTLFLGSYRFVGMTGRPFRHFEKAREKSRGVTFTSLLPKIR